VTSTTVTGTEFLNQIVHIQHINFNF